VNRKLRITLSVLGLICIVLVLLTFWPAKTIMFLCIIPILILSLLPGYVGLSLIYAVMYYISLYENRVLRLKYGYLIVRYAVRINRFMDIVRYVFECVIIEGYEVNTDSLSVSKREMSPQSIEEITDEDVKTLGGWKGKDKEIEKIRVTFVEKRLYEEHEEREGEPPKWDNFEREMQRSFKHIPNFPNLHFKLVWTVIREGLPEDLLKGGRPPGAKSKKVDDSPK